MKTAAIYIQPPRIILDFGAVTVHYVPVVTPVLPPANIFGR